MKATSRIVALLAGLAFVALPALAQKYPPEVQDALNVVRKHIDQLPNGKNAGDVTPQTASAVKTVFPNYRFVIARFRQFPVARVMPEGLRASNVFAVNKEGKLELLKDVKTLEKFFHDHQMAAKSEKDAKTVLAAWLTLTQEFHQDGMYKFEILEKGFAVAQDVGLNARGRLVVMAGGNGELVAELDYGPDGKIAKVRETAKIRPGPRPICQATKLLDTDPIVRRIAEQDLLIMGLSARDYLMEQRVLATPELRDSIDRVWRQIQANGW
jgi:hypothetical protein